MSRRYTIAATILAADLARLGDEVPAGTVVKVWEAPLGRFARVLWGILGVIALVVCAYVLPG